MQPKKIIIIALLFLSAIFTEHAYAQTADEIVKKHIDAIGGPEKWANVKSMKVLANMDFMNQKLPVTIVVVQNKSLRSETIVNDQKIIQAIDGNTGWTINPMTGSDKPSALPADAVSLQALQMDITGLYNYQEKGYKVELEGEEDLGGAKVYKLVISLPSNVKQTNYVSKETFHILKIKSEVDLNGQQVNTEIIQSDFKPVDGILLPFKSEIVSSAMPGMKIVHNISSVEINPLIPDDYFSMPK